MGTEDLKLRYEFHKSGLYDLYINIYTVYIYYCKLNLCE